MTAIRLAQSARPCAVPLVIDLDGTLVRTDLLHESAIKLARTQPLLLLALPVWLAQGKAVLKRRIAERVELDVHALPYNTALLDWIRTERATGRMIVLCTASDQRFAHSVAQHLGVFDEVIASDGVINVSAARKAQRLVERFGDRGFDYAGNAADDMAVWQKARHAIVVNATDVLRRAAAERATVERSFCYPKTGPKPWLRAMRLHQWLKNLLVLLPLAGAYRFDDWLLVQQALLAFVAFGLCASSVYLLNDLIDLESDRAHPRKRTRPLAAGELSVPQGLLLALALLGGSVALAATGRPAFMQWLGVYYLLTLAYSFSLKRRVIVDCLALGGLFTLRVIAGCAAVGLPMSFWLLTFSLFLFLSLAFVKRFSELSQAAKLGRVDARGRGYLVTDLPLVQMMGVAAGFSAVLVLALYINGDTVTRSYTHPQGLWLTVPILLYWISRMWMQAQRGNMHDDPLVFALCDRYSLACGALFAASLWVAR